MKTFWVSDLNVKGELKLKAPYQYEHLEQIPGAAELIAHFSSLHWRNSEEFETPLPGGFSHMTYRWRASADTAGVATLRCKGELATLSLLACGTNPDADRHTFQALQKHLLAELRNTEFEPAFDLMDLEERPMVAIIDFQPPVEPQDQMAVALTDRCFAAAYFRYHHLA